MITVTEPVNGAELLGILAVIESIVGPPVTFADENIWPGAVIDGAAVWVEFGSRVELEEPEVVIELPVIIVEKGDIVVELGGTDGKLEDDEVRLDVMDTVGTEVGGRESGGEIAVASAFVELGAEEGALDAAASKSVRFDKSSVGKIPPVFEQISTN